MFPNPITALYEMERVCTYSVSASLFPSTTPNEEMNRVVRSSEIHSTTRSKEKPLRHEAEGEFVSLEKKRNRPPHRDP